jgi:hypothetical protein
MLFRNIVLNVCAYANSPCIIQGLFYYLSEGSNLTAQKVCNHWNIPWQLQSLEKQWRKFTLFCVKLRTQSFQLLHLMIKVLGLLKVLKVRMRSSTSILPEGNLWNYSNEMKGVMMVWHFLAILNVPD